MISKTLTTAALLLAATANAEGTGFKSLGRPGSGNWGDFPSFFYLENGPRRCRDFNYKTGRCTVCPAKLYQDCPERSHTENSATRRVRGSKNGSSYCGFLGCELNCKVIVWDHGCGCNRGKPLVLKGFGDNGEKSAMYLRCPKSDKERIDRRRAERALGKAAAMLEMAESEPEAYGEGGDRFEELVDERAFEDVQDLQKFCALAKRENACGDSCEFITSDEAFKMFLPVGMSDPCGRAAKVADICAEACLTE